MNRVNKDTPSVSVVVLNFNGLHHLEECFDSLQALNYPAEKLEVILVDNHSKKSPKDLLKRKYPHIKLIENDKNVGFAEGANIGARAANGEFVAFLNNDTKVHPDWLVHLIAGLNISEGLVCVGSRILSWDGDAIDFIGARLNFYGNGFQEAFESKRVNDYLDDHMLLFACGGAMLISKKVFLDIGGFDRNYFAFFEDVDLGWRLWVLGYQVKLAAKSVVYHKGHSTASKFPPEWRYVMYERNALYTIIKNYNQENLEKILPVAILLSVRRAMEHAGINRAIYYAEQDSMPKYARPSVQSDQPADEPELTRPERLKKALKQEGVLGTVLKLIRRIWAIFSMYVLHRRPTREADLMNRVSVGHFVAIEEVIYGMPMIWEERERIQKMRKRPDSEILPLFGSPFRATIPTADYKRVQASLAKIFEIDRIFDENGK